MNTTQLEKSIKDLTNNINRESFLFDLLSIYDFPKATITRLKKGDGNLSKNEGEYLSKNKFFFKAIQDNDPHLTIDELQTNEALLKHRPRFLIVTDYKTFLAQDLKTYDSLDIPIKELADQHEFFFPWMGREKSKLVNEAVADIKAATKMGQLYDLIVENNPTFVSEEDKKHALNVFFAQLLFCLFAEDTGLFEDGIFRNTIATYSDEDGSDLDKILSNIFQSLDTKDKTNFPTYCKDLPYVGGELFKDNTELPHFSRKARANIIEASKLDWYEINPDIFGSMIQVISSQEDRASYGQHYTSVSNILKVINPLFMDSLNQQFESCDKEKDYEKLLRRIYALKIFDPASGSGNFLIVTFKELCRLEFRIFSALQDINPTKWTLASSGIRANQFYALTIQDFDAQIAQLSMYITAHQMNQELSDIFGKVSHTLPFSNNLNIKVTNSLSEDWEEFLTSGDEEIFVIGNPPYVSGKEQDKKQKADMNYVFSSVGNYKELDYVSAWFFLAAKFINDKEKSSFSFVTTGTVFQGAQVEQLWPKVLSYNLEIFFAYKQFSWKNNAANNAGVVCSIIGVRNISNKAKYILNHSTKEKVNHINGYLLPFKDIYIKKLNKQISNLPKMITGNSGYDGNNLMLSIDERNEILKEFPDAKKIIRSAVGAAELIKGEKTRYCLWISNNDLSFAKSIPFVKKRIDAVTEFRENGGEVAKSLINKSHQFRYTHEGTKPSLVVPIVSGSTNTSGRKYIPLDFCSPETIILSSAAVIYDAPIYIFPILTSYMHNLWVKTIAGRLGWSIRYLSGLCYNTFPIINLSNIQIAELENIAFEILNCREKYSEENLASLYDFESMPNDLKKIHTQNDLLIESLYSKKIFEDDMTRLNSMLMLYENLLKKNNA